MSKILRFSVIAGAIVASGSGAFAQSSWSGDQALTRAQVRAQARGDSQRMIFHNDTINGPRGDVIVSGTTVGRDPDLGVRVQILRDRGGD
jgi:hypothetical protein